MTDLHKAMTNDDVNKFQWCAKIAVYLVDDHDWPFDAAWELAESLHYNYVETGWDEDTDPLDVLKKDMTYWD